MEKGSIAIANEMARRYYSAPGNITNVRITTIPAVFEFYVFPSWSLSKRVRMVWNAELQKYVEMPNKEQS